MSALMFDLLIFDSLYSKELIKDLISLDGEVVLANNGITGPQRFLFIKIFRYICQKLELMYQKSCLRNNDERRDNIFDIQFPFHKITHKNIQKYMFILLLYDLCSIYFVNQTENEMFSILFTRDSIIPKKRINLVE